MKENVIIKSEHYSPSKIRQFLYGIPAACIALGIVLYLLNVDRSRGPNHWGEYWTIFDNMFDPFSFFPGLLIDLGILILIIAIIAAAWLKSYSLTVTDKRVYGNTSWGKQVDLPIDSVSAVSSGGLKGICVASSSGQIAFNLIKNRNEVRDAISNLLIERQNNKNNSSPAADNVEDLKKYKDLLDSGVISQEEFDAKKAQFLGL